MAICFNVRGRRQGGFTLIEVIITLAVVSIAMLAVMQSMNTHGHITSELEKRVLAGWVAGNLVAQLRYQAKLEKLKTGNSSDTIKMGGHSWRARTRISKTDVEKVFLVTVEVRESSNRKGKPLSALTTAVTDPT